MALMNMFATSSETRDTILVTLPFLNALIVVNPVVNPIIYGLFESNPRWISLQNNLQFMLYVKFYKKKIWLNKFEKLFH